MVHRLPNPIHRATTGVLGAIVGGLLCGCPSPEPDEKFNTFLEDTQEARDQAGMVREDIGGGMAVDISGEFLLAIETVIAPGLPLQFIATNVFVPNEGMPGGMLTMTLQPLALDQGSTTDPRTPVGDPLPPLDVPVDEAGSFAADLGELMVTGMANPITGSDITAAVLLNGVIIDEDTVCGTVAGMVLMPIMSPLDGSTFGSQRVEDTSPAGLPAMPLVTCPEGGGGGGSGGGSGG